MTRSVISISSARYWKDLHPRKCVSIIPLLISSALISQFTELRQRETREVTHQGGTVVLPKLCSVLLALLVQLLSLST